MGYYTSLCLLDLVVLVPSHILLHQLSYSSRGAGHRFEGCASWKYTVNAYGARVSKHTSQIRGKDLANLGKRDTFKRSPKLSVSDEGSFRKQLGPPNAPSVSSETLPDEWIEESNMV